MRPESQLAGDLRETIQKWSIQQRHLIELSARFADTDEWRMDGAATAAHWLSNAAEVEVSTAREWIRVGRKVRDLPATARAFTEGEVSYSKVRTLSRIATAENEDELLEIATSVPASRLGKALAKWMTANLEPDELDAYHQSRRSVRWKTEADGMVLFMLRLPPIVAGILIAVLTALASASTTTAERKGQRGPRVWPSLAQQRADAVEQLLYGNSATTTEMVIHVRGDGCTLDDGTPISETEAAAAVPGSLLRALIHDAEGRPINASGRRRHPSPRQKQVVKERDRSCVDCGSTDLLEFDHVPAFDVSGRSVVEELELRCAPCHHRRHRSGEAAATST